MKWKREEKKRGWGEEWRRRSEVKWRVVEPQDRGGTEREEREDIGGNERKRRKGEGEMGNQ